MKLRNELDFVKEKFAEHTEMIKNHVSYLKRHGEYSDLDTRLAWDCLRAFVGTRTICKWYDKYDCNDNHITTLGKRALKELEII